MRAGGLAGPRGSARGCTREAGLGGTGVSGGQGTRVPVAVILGAPADRMETRVLLNPVVASW